MIQSRVTPKYGEEAKMKKKVVASHSDMVDALVRDVFKVEPAELAALAGSEAKEQTRDVMGGTPSPDTLDGVALFLRRMFAAAIAMREHHGAVHLLTQRQARKAGWSSAGLANLCLVLAWATFTNTELAYAHPVLLEADEAAPTRSNRLVQMKRRLPSLESLQDALFGVSRIDTAAMSQAAQARESVGLLPGSRLVSVDRVLADWLGVDPSEVELPSDKRGRTVFCRNSRSAIILAMIVTEATEVGRVLQEESVAAVRAKTDADADLAGLPGAIASNASLLLGVAIAHESGHTAHVLAPDKAYAARLAEAGRRFHRQRSERDEAAEDAARLNLIDVAARGWVHVGRRAARRVAYRLVDRNQASELHAP